MSVQFGRKPLVSELQRRNTDQNQAGLGLMALSDLQSMAREEGEGMETTETESPSPALTPLPSLEHLLTSPDPKQGVFERRGAHCNSYSICTLYSEVRRFLKFHIQSLATYTLVLYVDPVSV